MSTPRVFLIRHGETEWSRAELHTGSTDLPLTENGESQVVQTCKALVGEGKLIVPRNLAHVYVSPRRRALQTVKLLDLGVEVPGDPSVSCPLFQPCQSSHRTCDASVEISENLQEWDYGDYEGSTIEEVRKKREQNHRDKTRPWNIFIDGCAGGETPEQVTSRLEQLIRRIKDQFEADASTVGPRDVVCVAHSHILSAFAILWTGRSLQDGIRLLLDTAGVAILSYEHHALDEPAIIIGPKC